jgi:hypothetical protein
VVVDDFILDIEPGPGNAVLRLLGSGFPQDEAWDSHYSRLRAGWAQALARLKVCIEQRHRSANLPGGGQTPGRQDDRQGDSPVQAGSGEQGPPSFRPPRRSGDDHEDSWELLP